MRGFSGEKLHFDSSSMEGENAEKKEKVEFVSLSPEIEYFLHKVPMGKLLSFIMNKPEGTAIKEINKELKGRTFPQEMLRLRAEGLIKADEGKLKPSFQIEDGKVPKSVLEKLEEIFFKIPDGRILREIEENPGIWTSDLISKLSMKLNCSETFIGRRVKEMGDFGLITRKRARKKAKGKRGLANFPKERGTESHPESVES